MRSGWAVEYSVDWTSARYKVVRSLVGLGAGKLGGGGEGDTESRVGYPPLRTYASPRASGL